MILLLCYFGYTSYLKYQVWKPISQLGHDSLILLLDEALINIYDKETIMAIIDYRSELVAYIAEINSFILEVEKFNYNTTEYNKRLLVILESHLVVFKKYSDSLLEKEGKLLRTLFNIYEIIRQVKKVDLKSVVLLDNIVTLCLQFIVEIKNDNIDNKSYINFKKELVGKINEIEGDMNTKLTADIIKLEKLNCNDAELSKLICDWIDIFQSHLTKISKDHEIINANNKF